MPPPSEYQQVIDRRARGLQYLTKVFRATGDTSVAQACEVAARQATVEASQGEPKVRYAVPLRETELPGAVFMYHLPRPVHMLSEEERLERVVIWARERCDWPREHQALRELQQLRAARTTS